MISRYSIFKKKTLLPKFDTIKHAEKRLMNRQNIIKVKASLFILLFLAQAILFPYDPCLLQGLTFPHLWELSLG